jgi:hypothetical protein
MDLLPELWIKIIFDLDCESILSLQLLSLDFYKLCKDNDLYIKRKFKGFPRIEGKAKLYQIAQNFTSREDYDIIFGQQGDINRLLSDVPDILRGDLLNIDIRTKLNSYSELILIYDGQKLLHLNYEGTLPEKFLVINDNIPIHYWMSTSNFVWFNISEIKKELINNITFNFENKRLQTSYKSYYIEYIEYIINDINYDSSYRIFLKFLTTKNLLTLFLNDPITGNMKDNTLYLSIHSYFMCI